MTIKKQKKTKNYYNYQHLFFFVLFQKAILSEVFHGIGNTSTLVAVPRPVNKGHRKNKKNCYGKFLEEGSVSVTRLNFSHHHRKKKIKVQYARNGSRSIYKDFGVFSVHDN